MNAKTLAILLGSLSGGVAIAGLCHGLRTRRTQPGLSGFGDMTFNEYQRRCLTNVKFKAEGARPEYNFFGLAGEVGEVMEEIKKYLRGTRTEAQFKRRLQSELGDVMWYIAKVADAYNIPMDAIAEESANKVSRKKVEG